jgi:hypothetical protein
MVNTELKIAASELRHNIPVLAERTILPPRVAQNLELARANIDSLTNHEVSRDSEGHQLGTPRPFIFTVMNSIVTWTWCIHAPLIDCMLLLLNFHIYASIHF